MISRNLPVSSRILKKRLFFWQILCLPGLYTSPPKTCAPRAWFEQGRRSIQTALRRHFNEAAGSVNMLCRQKLSDRATELTPLRLRSCGPSSMKGSGAILRFTFNPVGYPSFLHAISTDGEKRNRADARFGKNRVVSPKLKHVHMSRPHGLMHLCRFSCM